MTPSVVAAIYLSLACTTDCRTICGAEVVAVHDGDTMTVNLPGQGHPIFTQGIGVRMLGVDAAEMDSKEPCEAQKAVEARDLTRSIVAKAKKVDLQLMARDKYFRVLADVVADGKSIGQQLLDKRLAVPYDGNTKPKVDWCKQ